ncbi:hypothetical protein pb186bvf_011996 [Paramecium bursaria]
MNYNGVIPKRTISQSGKRVPVTLNIYLAQRPEYSRKVEKQSSMRRMILPSIKSKDYGLSEEEKQTYGDRVPVGYDKIELLGRGGFALVWLASDGMKKVALKQIAKPGNSKDLKFAFINSLHVVKILNVEQTNKDIWIVQELGGKTLSKQLHTMKGEFYQGERVYAVTETPMMMDIKDNSQKFIDMLRSVLQGIADINDQNVTHCDLKPDNILIDETGLKIIDFGSSFSHDEQDNFGMLTPEYMAPEVLDIVSNWSKYSQNYKCQIEALTKLHGEPKVDVWSFGAIVLDLINGVPNWLSYKGKIVRNGKVQLKFGLLAAKCRDFEKIMLKQQQLQIGTIVRNNCQFLSFTKQNQLEDLLRQCLAISPDQRGKARDLLNHSFFTQK